MEEPLSLRRFEQRSDVLSRRQISLIAALVTALHLVGLWQLARPWTPSHSATGIDVIWLPADPVVLTQIPPMPVPPTRVAAAAAPSRSAARGTPSALANAVPATPEAASESAAPVSTWLMPDGSLRWDRRAEAPTWTDQDRITRDRIVQLPGHSDAAAAEKVAIRLRRAMTPEDVVGAVLRFLFGPVVKDDCRAIERRLHMSDPGVTREIDLAKFRKQCAS